MTKMLVFTLHLKVDAKLTIVNEITRNLFESKLRAIANKMPDGKIMTLTEVIRKDGQRHLTRGSISPGTN